MKGDLTRSTFDRRKHFSSVRMQQGRVQLDADWNEQMDLTAHRVETEAVDLIGGCGGPLHDAGFHVVAATGDLSAEEQAREVNQSPASLSDPSDFYVSGGRYYVDGVLAENDRIVPYGAQPDLPLGSVASGMADPPLALPLAAGTYLAYLDVWRRHVTALEDDALREVALGGPDTATRAKTVWQMKLHELETGEAAGADCASPIASWESAIGAPTGKMAARAEAATASSDPCIVAPGAGYRRLENQLYRVEVHDGGVRNTAGFKWSRDNGSIVARLESQNAALDEWTVSTLGRDEVMRFGSGQWAELTDDDHELLGAPGTLVQVVRAQGEVLTVDLTTATGSVDMGDFPSNPRVRRWDGLITGVSNANWRALEDGVQVRFFAGTYRTGDYWQIPARTATADVEWPADPSSGDPALELPHGIEHDYCRLALMAYDGSQWTSITDCRHLFPPVSELTSLFYVGGTGQETMPAQPQLPLPLAAGVANGEWPVEGATVRFTVKLGSGTLNGSSGSIDVVTNAKGLAQCSWTVDGSNESQQVEATLLDAAGDAVHLPVRFNAALSLASEVAYRPAQDCALLAGTDNVQDALDLLCKSSHQEPGIRVDKIAFRDAEFLNDGEVPIETLGQGIVVVCDGEPVGETVKERPTCFVTLYLPYPLTRSEVEDWGLDAFVGYRPLRLRAQVEIEGDLILWNADERALAWLAEELLPRVSQFDISRVLAYLTVKGNFIWQERDESRFYLDGELYGALRDDGRTGVVLPSGDGRRGGDLEAWFWLQTRQEQPGAGFELDVSAGRFTVTGVVRDDTGAGLPGVVVELRGGGTTRFATTDAGGKFKFVEVAIGSYTVSVELGGVRIERPVGVRRLDPTDFPGLGVARVPGIGPAFAGRLTAAGVTHSIQIAEMEPDALAATIGIPLTTAQNLVSAARNLLSNQP